MRFGDVRRAAGCGALLALLAVCGYMGARPTPTATVSVPVMLEAIPASALAADSMEKTLARLDEKRAGALSLLEDVLQDPAAGEREKQAALGLKTQIAARMAQEADAEELLLRMGVGETAVILGEGTAHVVAPWQAAENEQSRVKIIDAVATAAGVDASNVKIILAKK